MRLLKCICGKVKHQIVEDAIREAKRQPSKLPLWVYECTIAPKWTFHLTTRKGIAKHKITEVQ